MARKAAAGSGTIRKKTIIRNGKEYSYWEARYTAGYDPGTGKQIQKSITGQTQKEVRLKMQEMKEMGAQSLWVRKIPWRRKWQPTPVCLPREFHGQRGLVGYSPRGCKESNMTEHTHTHTQLPII